MESLCYVGIIGNRTAKTENQSVASTDPEHNPARRGAESGRLGCAGLPRQALCADNSLIAVFSSHSDAAAAVRELEKGGFPVTDVSIAGKINDPENGSAGLGTSEDHAGKRRKKEPVFGYPPMLLAASTSVGVAGIGPTLLAGPLAALISVDSGAGNSLELSVISAGFSSLGIPMCTIVRHESSLQTDKVLLLTIGAAAELIRAKEILRSTRPEEMHLHFADETRVDHA
jgi:hypothetical protein